MPKDSIEKAISVLEQINDNLSPEQRERLIDLAKMFEKMRKGATGILESKKEDKTSAKRGNRLIDILDLRLTEKIVNVDQLERLLIRLRVLACITVGDKHDLFKDVLEEIRVNEKREMLDRFLREEQPVAYQLLSGIGRYISAYGRSLGSDGSKRVSGMGKKRPSSEELEKHLLK